jgi:hypothetical protein
VAGDESPLAPAPELAIDRAIRKNLKAAARHDFGPGVKVPFSVTDKYEATDTARHIDASIKFAPPGVLQSIAYYGNALAIKLWGEGTPHGRAIAPDVRRLDRLLTSAPERGVNKLNRALRNWDLRCTGFCPEHRAGYLAVARAHGLDLLQVPTGKGKGSPHGTAVPIVVPQGFADMSLWQSDPIGALTGPSYKPPGVPSSGDGGSSSGGLNLLDAALKVAGVYITAKSNVKVAKEQKKAAQATANPNPQRDPAPGTGTDLGAGYTMERNAGRVPAEPIPYLGAELFAPSASLGGLPPLLVVAGLFFLAMQSGGGGRARR